MTAGNIHKCAVYEPRHSDDIGMRDFVRKAAATLKQDEELLFLESPAFGNNLSALSFYSQRIFTTVNRPALEARLAAGKPLAVFTTEASLPASLKEMFRVKLGDRNWSFSKSH